MKRDLFTPVKVEHPSYLKMLTPLSYLKKESIAQKGKLSKWGDVDLDATPNVLDCDPRDVSKDGKIILKVNN